MKNIVMVFSYLGVGGAQRRAANLANYLSEKGYNVKIAALLGSNGSIEDENFYNTNDKIEFISVPDFIQNSDNKAVTGCLKSEDRKIRLLKKLIDFLGIFGIKIRKLQRAYMKIKARKEMNAFLKSAEKDTLILHFGFNIFKPVYYAARVNKMKVCYAETNSSEKYKAMSEYAEIMSLVKKADARIFQTKVQMTEHSLDENERTTVIHNPISPDLPQPYEGERKKIITNFSALKRQKNFLLLIKAFQRLSSEFEDYRLHLYSDSKDAHGGEYYNELMNYINQNGLQEKVEIRYMCSDVHEIVKDCSMFVLSSDYEGISNSMLEAMAIGLPTICTDCAGGGAREIIEDGVNGLLVPVGEEKPLYEAMKCFIVNKSFANECGKNAAKIRNYFSDEKVYAKWLEFIERIIA